MCEIFSTIFVSLFCSEEFDDGDSGTVIYVEHYVQGAPTERYALAMHKGVRPGTGPGTLNLKPIYDGIVIGSALDEIRQNAGYRT